jgi:hypothetical protein
MKAAGATRNSDRVLASVTAVAAALIGMAMLWMGFFAPLAIVMTAASVVIITVVACKLAQPDQLRPSTRESSRTLRRMAIASLLWPALVVVLLYGEWLLATWSLGHLPRPSADDPKNIAGSNLVHFFTLAAILGAIPAALLAPVLSAIEIFVNRPTIARALVRVVAVIASWAVLAMLFKWDPGRVLYWWMD